MLYQDSDTASDFSFNSDPDRVLSAIQALGSKFVSSAIDHPKECNRDRRDIRGVRRAAREYLTEHKLNPLAVWKVFEAVYADELKINSWTGEAFLGKPEPWAKTSLPKMLNQLEDVLGLALLPPKDFLDRRFAALIQNSYFSPVEEYLKGLPKLSPHDWSDWNRLAEMLFGTTNPQHQVKLSRWLIGAVARAMNPGCKMDSALVIRGKQGIGKTSFLQALFGEHFRTLHSHQSMLEQQRGIQPAWGCELGELEATFRAKDISALKAFLTETHDSYRDLNKELGAPRPRHCVFAGTTNETAFLNDSTGSRRFWVIDAGSHSIHVEWVKANRDKIWAVAYDL